MVTYTTRSDLLSLGPPRRTPAGPGQDYFGTKGRDMVQAFTHKAFVAELQALRPTVDNIRNMLGAARHAFNRHSVKELETLAALHRTVTLELDLVFEKVENLMANKASGEQTWLPRLQGLLTHLEIMTAHVAALAEPIRMKCKSGALFTDEDVFFINNFFSKLTGFMRGLVDVFKYRDPLLRKYLLTEAEALLAECFAIAQDHETRMMDGFGHPQAWGIFLAILDQGRLILRHFMDVVRMLDGAA